MRRVETEEWPAPVKGWWQSGNLANAPKDAAEVLDNYFPTAQGVRVRRGKTEYADCGAAVTRLLSYAGGGTERLFGCTETKIFDAVRLAGGGSNAWGDLEGLASGDWSRAQVSTSAGEFLVAVNGADHAIYYDGTNINPITAVSVNDLAFDAESAAFAVGETVTGGTSSATAEILAIAKTSATAGTLKVGTITGTFQDNEALTSASGAAVSNIPSGTSAASSVTITGVTTASLSQCWLFKERLFFVEENTLSFWYLPAKSIGGAATEFPLGSIFTKGGYLLFGATWSIDSGSGLDDVCLFVTDQGEVAVYEGTDPASASTFSLVGVYDIGEPVNKHGWFRAGGDLAIMTTDGIVSISEVLRKDRAAVQASAITFPIEDAWRDAVANATSAYPITATLWARQTMLLCGIPTTTGGQTVAYVANSRTGAWCRYTGWDVRCSAVFDDNLYFGSADGKVYRAENGGQDDGASYTALCVPKFSDAGPERKFLTRAQVLCKAPVEPTLKVVGLGDYRVPEITPPQTTATAPPATAPPATWGVGVWGTFVWGARTEKNTFSIWKKVRGKGFAVSAGVLVTSFDTAACDVEIISIRLRYERGSVL